MDTVTASTPPRQIGWAHPDDRGAPGRGARHEGRVTLRRRTGLASPASWRELCYAVIDLVPAVALFSAILALLSAGAGLLVVYVGVPVLMAGLLLARLGGALQVGLARSLLGVPVMLPGPPRRRAPGIAGLVRAVLTDGAAWRAVGYFLIKIGLAPVTFAVAVFLYAWGLGAVTYPVWRPFLPARSGTDGAWHRGAQLWSGQFVDTWPTMAIFAAIGLLVLLAAPHVVRWFLTIDRLLVTALLARR